MVHRHAPAKAWKALTQVFQTAPSTVARELAPARLRSRRKTCNCSCRVWGRFAAQREQAPSPQQRYLDPNPSMSWEISLSQYRFKQENEELAYLDNS